MSENDTNEKHHGQIVVLYRGYAGWSQQQLADALGTNLRTVQRMEKQRMIRNLKRRELLVGLLGIPATLIDVGNEAYSAPSRSQKKPVLNQDHMFFLENAGTMHWNMYRMGGPLYTAPSLDIHMQEVRSFVQSAQSTVWHTRTLVLWCLGYQLQGCIYGDAEYQRSHIAFQKALRIAQELQDAELTAATLAREGVVYARNDAFNEAITHLNGALTVIRGSGFPQLRGSILCALSETYAKTKQKQESFRCIGLAERTIEQYEHGRERSQFLSSAASIQAAKGTGALLLNDYERAYALIEKSLKTYPPTQTPGKARLIAQKAETFYGLGLIDDCIMSAEEGLLMADAVGSKRIIARIKNVHTSLCTSKWQHEPSIARLGALLKVSEKAKNA